MRIPVKTATCYGQAARLSQTVHIVGPGSVRTGGWGVLEIGHITHRPSMNLWSRLTPVTRRAAAPHE